MIMIGARSLVAERKVLLIPDGLNGERVDAAVALGLPRSRVVDMIGAGHVLLDGASINKSDRVSVGSMLEVELDHPRLATVRPEQVEGVVIVYDDDDIVVIDKPVGVAAHPSLGWSGPDVLSHLAGAGFRISTSGVSERRGIVQRLDVGTSGLMVVAKSELAYTILKRAFRSRSVDKIYHALVQGHPDPFTGTIEAPIGRTPALTTRWRSCTAATVSPTTPPWRLSSRRPCSRSSWKPVGPIRSAFTWRRFGILHRRSGLWGGSGPRGQARPGTAVAARGPPPSCTRRRVRRCSSNPPTRLIFSTHWRWSASGRTSARLVSRLRRNFARVNCVRKAKIARACFLDP